MEVRLTNYREPDKVIALTTDTEIEIQGECEIRFFSMEIGCNSLVLHGDGKLKLHPNRKGNYTKWYLQYEREVKDGRVQYL